MNPSIKELKQKILKSKNYTIIYGEQNFDLSDILFPEVLKKNMIRYQADDKLSSNYTKLLSFFNLHNLVFEYKNNLSVNDIDLSKAGVIKGAVKGVGKLIHNIKYRKYNIIRKNFNAYSFTNEELNILTKFIDCFCRQNNELIIIDNIENAPSVDLLFYKKLLESKFLELYVPNLQILFISDKSVVNEVNLQDITSDKLIKIILKSNELNELLSERYKNKNLDIDRLNHYLSLCKNNLHLLDSVINISTNISDDSDVVRILTNLVHDVLKSIKCFSALEFAAIIGMVFDLTSISQAMTVNTDEIAYQFEEANINGLILKKDDNFNFEFIDEIIRNIICKFNSNPSEVHLKFARYLNRTNPKEHLQIAKHYYESGQIESAILQFFCYNLNSYLENKEINENLDVVQKIIKEIEVNPRIYAAYIELLDLLSSFRSKNFINIFYYENSDSITMFVNYVKTVLLYLNRCSYTEDKFTALADKFEESYIFLNTESLYYQKIQCLYYLIDIYTYRINNIVKSKEKIKELNDLVNDKNIDYFGDINLQIRLTRKIATTMNAETAFAKMRYFHLSLQKSRKCIDRIEYFKFLSDYLGFALYSGNFDNLSNDFVDEYSNCLATAKQLNYPKVYKAYTNKILYRILNNDISKEELCKFLNEESNKDLTGRMYLFNISAISMLCNDLTKAENLLNDIVSKSKDNLTCFYDYCFNANLTSLYLLKKEYDKAEQFNNKILEQDYEWEPDFIEIMKYRAKLFAEFIRNKKAFTPYSLLNCFQNNEIYLSNIWKFLGKGILFSELMFYRE